MMPISVFFCCIFQALGPDGRREREAGRFVQSGQETGKASGQRRRRTRALAGLHQRRHQRDDER